LAEPRVRWLAAPPPGFRELLAADANATPAHQPGVARAFAVTLTGMSARFLAIERGERLCGAMPVVVQRRASFHWIHALPMLLPGAPLARDPDREDVDRAAARALEALAIELGSVGGSWACYRPVGPSVTPETLAIPGGETRRFEAAIVPLREGLEPLLHRMDRKTRKEMRQARDRGLEVAEDPGALEATYALYATQSRGWRAHRTLPLELLRRLLSGEGAESGEAPPARLFTVRDSRGLLAGVLALDGPHETMLWWSGTHPGARARHAFPLLLWSVIEWAHARGRARVNLGASADREAILAFKGSLGAQPVHYPVRWLDARHAHRLGRAVAALQTRMRRGRPLGEPE
jgi:hypothetical protein